MLADNLVLRTTRSRSRKTRSQTTRCRTTCSRTTRSRGQLVLEDNLFLDNPFPKACSHILGQMPCYSKHLKSDQTASNSSFIILKFQGNNLFPGLTTPSLLVLFHSLPLSLFEPINIKLLLLNSNVEIIYYIMVHRGLNLGD